MRKMSNSSFSSNNKSSSSIYQTIRSVKDYQEILAYKLPSQSLIENTQVSRQKSPKTSEKDTEQQQITNGDYPGQEPQEKSSASSSSVNSIDSQSKSSLSKTSSIKVLPHIFANKIIRRRNDESNRSSIINKDIEVSQRGRTSRILTETSNLDPKQNESSDQSIIRSSLDGSIIGVRQSLRITSLPKIMEKPVSKYNVNLPRWKNTAPVDFTTKNRTTLATERNSVSYNDPTFHTSISHRLSKAQSSSKLNMGDFYLKKIRNTFQPEELPLFSWQGSARKTEREERKSHRLVTFSETKIETRASVDNLQVNRELTDEEIEDMTTQQEILDILKQTKGTEVIELEDMEMAKKTYNLQDASPEMNQLINSKHVPEALDIVEVDVLAQKENKNAGRPLTPTKLIDASIYHKDQDISKRDSTTGRKRESHSEDILFKKIKAWNQNQPPKKKEYYNKWYIPLEYWKVKKEPNYKKTKYQELKKDNLFVYNSIHNYEKNKDYNPLGPKPFKGIQQIRHENAQLKLRKAPMIERIKKNLSETNLRIPKILRDIQQENPNVLEL